MDDEWGEIEEGPFEYEAMPANLAGAQKQLVAGQNAFAISAYQRLPGSDEDFCFSPASIWFLLCILHAGTNGPTRDQIAETLAYPDHADSDAQIGSLMQMSNFEGPHRQLSIKNAIWFAKDMNLNPAFRDLVLNSYAVSLDQADFAAASGATLRIINDWVADQTNQRIQNLLSEREVNAETRIALVNTAYFKAAWMSGFSKRLTKETEFRRGDGSSIMCQMMHRTGYYEYLEDANYKAIRLPYWWNETEILIALPTEAEGLLALETSVNASEFRRICDTLDQAPVVEVELSLPKFKIESRSLLNEAMADIGIRQLFSPEADFSPISSEQFPMSMLVHQAVIEVDEDGTEAAAATAMMVAGAAFNDDKPKPKIFRADHPFLFLIRDSRTGMILFMGRYTGMTVQ
jgi:serpin B